MGKGDKNEWREKEIDGVERIEKRENKTAKKKAKQKMYTLKSLLSYLL